MRRRISVRRPDLGVAHSTFQFTTRNKAMHYSFMM